ncbi:MAG: LysE/ArgO family amino acid transporter [Brevibacterium aurantiacum]|uniref:Amino acid transporter n=1 Tax=Brevibacterium aurantiacum TaxID=273384 RepID=A0A2A3X264_BREAU|nr:LysE/ArgO family amino acid transporter [Brevibacterium aurantiacum]MDN5592960.1 LysE/ArgO family amino acid transporter [Brevibacterium sp.]AZL07073.1 amino acid transporter [Brevibacterium aurantiacum]AZL14308.1 amino acid transporter [Brevibacterium aurantiacum]AZT94892.1 amino acid transporter [Brevibacterium aurantiacum]AZT98624.1 amino acid transporter [Brevibacterium aurantiacum]
MLTHLVSGTLAGWSLIIAVGPQNALVLRQGIRREHLGVVLTICILADVLLIGAGTVGIGAIVLLAPWALEILRWLGVAYLLWYAWGSLKSAREASGLEADTHQRSLKSIIATTLALTFLNPGVYLDTVVMLGNLANQQGPGGALPFTIGAMLGSLTWFLGIGYGARGLSRFLAKPRVWQVLDVLIAVVLVILALRLAFG